MDILHQWCFMGVFVLGITSRQTKKTNHVWKCMQVVDVPEKIAHVQTQRDCTLIYIIAHVYTYIYIHLYIMVYTCRLICDAWLRFSSSGHHTALGRWLRAGPDNQWSLSYLNKCNVSVPLHVMCWRVPHVDATKPMDTRWIPHGFGQFSNTNLSCSKGKKVCEPPVSQSTMFNAAVSKTHKKASSDFTKRYQKDV